jgi:hypothetical protein
VEWIFVGEWFICTAKALCGFGAVLVLLTLRLVFIYGMISPADHHSL